jgi:hypothetical protein
MGAGFIFEIRRFGPVVPSQPLTLVERIISCTLFAIARLFVRARGLLYMRVLGIVALCAALGGCASVTRGTTENISIASTPSGAQADIAGLDIPTQCLTPCVVQAKRNADITVTISKEGYDTQIIPLTKEITGSGGAGFAGNILLGGVIGMGVDAATGAAQDHKPNPVIVTLQPVAPPAPPARSRPRPVKRVPAAGT